MNFKKYFSGGLVPESEVRQLEMIAELQKDVFKLKHKDNPLFDGERLLSVELYDSLDVVIYVESLDYKNAIFIPKKLLPVLIQQL